MWKGDGNVGPKPELGIRAALPDVDMHRLVRIAHFRVEVKAETVPAEDSGQGWDGCRLGVWTQRGDAAKLGIMCAVSGTKCRVY